MSPALQRTRPPAALVPWPETVLLLLSRENLWVARDSHDHCSWSQKVRKSWWEARATYGRSRGCEQIFFKWNLLVPLRTLSFLCGNAKSTILPLPGPCGPLQVLLSPATGAEWILGIVGTHCGLTGAVVVCLDYESFLPSPTFPEGYWANIQYPGQAGHQQRNSINAPRDWGFLESRTWKASFRSHLLKALNLGSIDLQALVDELEGALWALNTDMKYCELLCISTFMTFLKGFSCWNKQNKTNPFDLQMCKLKTKERVHLSVFLQWDSFEPFCIPTSLPNPFADMHHYLRRGK